MYDDGYYYYLYNVEIHDLHYTDKRPKTIKKKSCSQFTGILKCQHTMSLPVIVTCIAQTAYVPQKYTI